MTSTEVGIYKKKQDLKTFLVEILVTFFFFLGQDRVIFLVFLVKILFSSCFLGQDRVFFLYFLNLTFFLVESVFSFFVS